MDRKIYDKNKIVFFRLKTEKDVPKEFEIMKSEDYYYVHYFKNILTNTEFRTKSLSLEKIVKDELPEALGVHDEEGNWIELSVEREDLILVPFLTYRFANERDSHYSYGIDNLKDNTKVIVEDKGNGVIRNTDNLLNLFNLENASNGAIISTGLSKENHWDGSWSLSSRDLELKNKDSVIFGIKRKKVRLKTFNKYDLISYKEDGIDENTFPELFSKDWYFYDENLELYSNRERIGIDGWNINKEDLVEFDPDEKDERVIPIWSEIQTRNVNMFDNYLSEQIRVRYAMYDRPRNGLSNIIIDSFAPRVLYKAKFNTEQARNLMNKTKTAVAISPMFANMFGVKQMEIEQLCRILGYEPKDIQRLFNQVKREKYSILFIGYGGTNVNTIHWLNSMAKMVNAINVFEYTAIWEKEEAEISNMLRFPLDPTSVKETIKVGNLKSPGSLDKANLKRLSKKTNLLGDQLDRISKEIEIVDNYYYAERPNEINQNAKTSFHYTTTGSDEEPSEIKIKSKKHIIYGAPNISTRQELSKYGNFISATHGDAGCRLDLNPEQDDTLQVESYGIIQLGGFFMNQLRMAIGLLETLSDPEFDPSEQDKELLVYEFKGADELKEDGKPIARKPDRGYNFQLQHNGLVMTEEQANDAV